MDRLNLRARRGRWQSAIAGQQSCSCTLHLAPGHDRGLSEHVPGFDRRCKTAPRRGTLSPTRTQRGRDTVMTDTKPTVALALSRAIHDMMFTPQDLSQLQEEATVIGPVATGSA